MAGSRLARNEGQQTARRSLASTTPADVPSSRGAWLSDRPGWCVDLGPTLVAMTTCDLWLALAKGDVTPQTKVWREGMPYWDGIATVPEFALALPDASVWAPAQEPAPVALVTAEAAVAMAELRDRPTLPAPMPAPSWPAASSAVVVDGMTLAPGSDFVTPAPMVVEHRSAAPPPSGTRRRRFPQVDRRGALSVAFGAAVAIGALALATSGPVPDRATAANGGQKPLISAHAAALGGREMGVGLALPGLAGITPEAPREVQPPSANDPIGASTASPASTASMVNAGANERAVTAGPAQRKPRGPHAADRGQRRARAGAKNGVGVIPSR